MLFANVPTKYAFSGEAVMPAPTDGKPAKASIAITDPDFKYPQLWKSNIAVDYKFGNGWIATAEVLYNKDINAIYHVDINHPNLDRSWVRELNGPDNRPYFLNNKLNSEAYDVIMMTNTSKGYSIYTTLQLQKDFIDGPLKGLYVNGSYTFVGYRRFVFRSFFGLQVPSGSKPGCRRTRIFGRFVPRQDTSPGGLPQRVC